MNASRKFYISLLFLFVLNNMVYGQDVSPGNISRGLANANPSTSVDYTRGIMNYSMPLFSINQDNFNVPVSLDYLAGGIKVDDNPSFAGLGWTLSYGGSVTRTMRGSAADEDPNYGILKHPIPTDVSSQADEVEKVNSNKLDGESDIFTLNLLGKSVKFLLSKYTSVNQLEIKTLDRTDFSISCKYDGSKITGWTVLDGEGNEYDFESSLAGGIYVNNPVVNLSYSTQATTAWNLKKIKLFNNDSINYIYGDAYAEPVKALSYCYEYYGLPFVHLSFDNPSTQSQINLLKQQLSGNNTDVSQIGQFISDIQFNMIMETQRQERSFSFAGTDLGNSTDSSANGDANTNSFDLAPSYLNSFDILLYESQLNWYTAQLNQIQAVNTGIMQQILNLMYFYSPYTKQSEVITPTQSSMFGNSLLRKIEYRNGELDFDYQKILGYDGYYHYSYSRIQRKDMAGDPLSSVLFNVNRNGYLKQIQFVNNSDQIDQSYNYTYYDEANDSVNNRVGFRNAQDYWGYNNGKFSNTNLLPEDPFYSLHSTSSNAILQFSSVFGMANVPSDYTTNAGANRMPDSNYTNARSLQSISSSLGGIVKFVYENNKVYFKDIDSNVLVGGMRIKEVIVNDGHTSDTTSYKYDFPLLSNRYRIRSSGRLTEWQTKSFAWAYTYPNATDYYVFSEPVYSGHLYNDGSNNDVLYHYVEEIRPDGSTIGYKYPETSDTQLAGKDMHNNDLDDALLAKIYYDKTGRIIRVERSSYYYPNQFLGDRGGEYNILKAKYNYFDNDSAVYPDDSLLQIKKEPIHYNQQDLMSIYPNSNMPQYTTTFNGTQYSVNGYTQIYIPNYSYRVTHTPQSYTYRIPINAAILLREKEVLQFNSEYDTSIAYNSSNYPTLPDEKAYLYERLINSSIPRKRKVLHYAYTNPASIYPTLIKSNDGKGNIVYEKIKYSGDYQLPASEPVYMLKYLHDLNEVIERQKWKSKDGGTTFQLASSILNEYGMQTVNGLNYLFPVNKFMIEQNKLLNMASLGYTQAYNSTPPYSSIFWENKNLYKLQNNYTWAINGNFSRLESVKNAYGLVQKTNVYNRYTGEQLVNSSNTEPDHIAVLDFGPFQPYSYYINRYNKFVNFPLNQNQHGLTYEQMATMSYPQLFSGNYDVLTFNHVQIAKDIMSVLTNFENTTQVAGILNNQMYKDYKSIFSSIAYNRGEDSFSIAFTRYNADVVNSSLVSTRSQLSSAFSTSNVPEQVLYFYLFSLQNVFRDVTELSLFNFDRYESIMSEQRNLLDFSEYTGTTCLINVEDLVAAGKKINLFAIASSSSPGISAKAIYQDGTSSAYQAVSFGNSVGSTDILLKAQLALSAFNNQSSIKQIQFQVYPGSKASGNQLFYFLAVPENALFQAKGFLPDGNVAFTFNQNGHLASYLYDGFGNRNMMKNYKGFMTATDTLFNKGNSSTPLKMLKITIINRYNYLTSLSPIITQLKLKDMNNYTILYKTVNIVPNQKRSFEIPASKYNINIDGAAGTILLNGTPFSNGSQIDASNLSNITIEIEP